MHDQSETPPCLPVGSLFLGGGGGEGRLNRMEFLLSLLLRLHSHPESRCFICLIMPVCLVSQRGPLPGERQPRRQLGAGGGLPALVGSVPALLAVGSLEWLLAVAPFSAALAAAAAYSAWFFSTRPAKSEASFNDGPLVISFQLLCNLPA